MLEQGDTGWYKIQSLFAWARMWGAPIPLAYALQGALIVALGVALVRLWRSAAPYPLKAAALCLAAILATPYTFDYDMMVLAPAIAFLAADGLQRGFGPWEKTALAALWLVAARRPQRRAGDPDSARRAGDAGDVHSACCGAAQFDFASPMAFFQRISPKIANGTAARPRGHDIAAFERRSHA